jgi:hypothetical protein
MEKKSNRGGIRENSGRKALYNEKTTTLTVRIPASKKEEIKQTIKQILMNMKTKLLLLMLIIPAFAHSQEPPKKANTIIVYGVTYNEAMSQLLDKGYLIDKSDKDVQYIQTAKKPSKKGLTYLLKIAVRIKDSTMIVTGIWNNELTIHIGAFSSPLSESIVENRGMKGSILNNSWNDLNSFALSFNKPVEYAIK